MVQQPQQAPDDVEILRDCAATCVGIKRELANAVIGQANVIEQLLVTLLARGHALLVGVPGLAKTLLVASLARTLGLSFGRVQFTPDLLPADITGTDVMNEVDVGNGRIQRELSFLPGPIFANLVLADEINRAPPKTQAALLQAMQERQVTAGTRTHRLPEPFQVFATRNPIEQEGTYPLPESELDRFLLEVPVGYPSASEEMQIARRTTSGVATEVACVAPVDRMLEYGRLVPRIPITDEAVELAINLARATRPECDIIADVAKYVRFGAGPRGSQSLVLAAKAKAAVRGEPAADIDDVISLALPALRHRLVLGYRAEAEDIRPEDILRRVAEHYGVVLPS